MKKLLFAGFFVMAFLALGAMVAFACGENATSAKTASAKSSCAAYKANASLASSTGKTCSASKATASLASSTGKTCSASKAKASLASSTGKTCTAAEKAACAAKASLAKAEGKAEAEACSPANIANCAAKARAEHAAACGKEGKCDLATISITGMTCGNCETAVRTALTEIEGVNRVLEVCYKAGFAAVCVNPELAKEEILTKAVSSTGYNAEIIPAVAKISSDENASTGKAICGAHKDKKSESDIH